MLAISPHFSILPWVCYLRRVQNLSMDKLMGVVILYHPDTNALMEHLQSYLSVVDHLLLLDNSESPSSDVTEILSKDASNKIQYQYFGENRGIAERLNQAIEYAQSKGYRYLLTMDQDTGFQPSQMLQYWQKVQDNQLDKVVQFGANCQPDFTPISDIPQQTNNLITSGTILDLSYIEQIGPFDQALFIDFVDTEFSFRVVEKGYRNLLFADIVLQHRIGYLKMSRSIKNFKSSARILHAPIRVYYILRNGLYLLFRSPFVKGENRKLLLSNMKILKNDLIYHNQKGAVYSNVLRAVYDFVFGKMGKKQS
ncbi:MAG: hypothetical protein CFE25_17300 [Chitinophagaceae bacterium BSSC1]|nr:MAG: hypothetical protein CFE25_17300 [Chitinophagaceae bacterium BSSC1]